MANAQTAPLKKWQKEDEYLEMEFDVSKKYMFQLATENPKRELPVIGMIGQQAVQEPHKKFKPFQNLVFTSQIVWKGQRRMIRYYDGCTTIFVDEQPKDREEIKEFIAQTRRRDFLNGKFGAYGDERMLLLYMMICSWNAESPFRTRSADAIFVPVDNVKTSKAEELKIEEQEQALKLAKEASKTKMMIHANYLGIPFMDYDSGNEYGEDEIRVEYRKAALRDASGFIESYGNKAIEMKYYINKALEQGLISNKFNPNKATWAKSNSEICDISGLRSNESIAEKLFEFSQLEDGAEFQIQLKALFND